MSIYGYHASNKRVKTLLQELDPALREATLTLTQKQIVNNCPEESDAGQVLDYEGLDKVWKVVRVRLKYEKRHHGGRELVGCEVDVAQVEDAFVDELTEAGTSRALASTTSAEHAAMEQSTLGLARPGIYAIRTDGGYAQIQQVYWARVLDKKRTDEDHRNNPRRRKIGKTVLMVEYRYEETVTAKRILDKVDTCRLDKFEETYSFIEGSFDSHLKLGQKLLEGGELPPQLAEEIEREQQQDSQASSQLVTSSNPDYLRGVAQRAERNANTAQVLEFAMQRNMTELRNRMSGMMSTLHEAMERFTVQMEKVHRLIITLELYLGVHESLIQIAEGAPAPLDASITLRQLVLYADEEFGDPTRGGLTFKELPEFDSWLVDSKAYQLLAPEQRCVVAIKPRRYNRRTASGDVMPSMQDEKGKALDGYTYLLIRNGDNLYRIQTPNVEVGNTLFPLRADFQKLLNRMNEVQEMEQKVLEGEVSEWQLERLRNTVEGELHGYQKSVLLLQGLLFRTTVLHPLPPNLNLMKPETYGGMVQFVYDAEALLPSGRMSFNKWQDDINSRIQRGSRVLVAIYKTSKGNYIENKSFKSRFTLANLYRDDSVPPLPDMGVYQVENYDSPSQEYVYDDIPWDQAPKKERSSWERENREWDDEAEDYVIKKPQPATLSCRRYDAKGHPEFITSYKRQLVIRYNPGDEVREGWGRYGSHGRKNTVGFRIDPEHDEWLFNYDELTIDDINFYLTERVERANYATMMPFLYELRHHLQQELDWEREFTKVLGLRLSAQLGGQLPAGVDMDALAQEAIRWYKLEKVKLKRSLTDQDAKALSMVEQRVRYYLRERYQVEVDANADYRKKTLIWYHEASRRSFVATGLLKATFVQECFDYVGATLPMRYFGNDAPKTERVSRARIDREMQDTTLTAAVALALKAPGKVQELPK
jgi:hypothetical protein